MNSLVPSKYANIPSIRRLEDRLKNARRTNGELREKTENSVGTLEALGFTQVGAGLCGVAMSRDLSEGAIGAIGATAAAAGWFLNQPSLVTVASGFLAPLTAGMVARYVASNAAKSTTTATV